MYRIFLIVIYFSAISVGFGQPVKEKVLNGVVTDASIKIDGKLNDSGWQHAAFANHFVQAEPQPGKPALLDTDVRLLYSRDYLYISAFCKDSTFQFRSPDMKRDFDELNHDYFGVSIDGFNDKRNAMAFITNPYGAQRDLLAFDDRLYDTNWDGLWTVRTTRTDSGWVAEMAIPWKTLRYARADSTSQFGINFFRRRRASNEVSAWSPFPWSLSPYRMDYAGVITNLRPPSPRQNIRIQPYLLMSHQKEKGSETNNDDATTVKVGGEVKWLITPNNILDVTLNTDFAQADVDRQVNNLTRFSVYFPERRQFFLENAGLFGIGLTQQSGLSNSQMIIPFFSRRIGLDETARPVSIDAGARFVHRTVKRNFGAMVVQQSNSNTLPATTFAVLRHVENIGKQNRIGAVGTYAGTENGNSFTWGADGFFRLNKYLSIQTMATATHNQRQKSGYAGFVQTIYKSNKWVAHYTQSIVTENYSPAAGFVAQTNLIGTSIEAWPEIQGKWLPKFSRYFEPGFAMEMFHSATSGQLQQFNCTFFPLYSDFNNGGYAGLFITPTYQRLENTFTPLRSEINSGTYLYVRYLITFGTDPSKKGVHIHQWRSG